MEAKELRIGNYLKRLDESIFQVSHYDFERILNIIEPLHPKPIPLTEEWLLKFGFEMYEFDNKANQFRFKERLIVCREGFLYDYGTSVKLEYVHRLQNLYFALVGSELQLLEADA